MPKHTSEITILDSRKTKTQLIAELNSLRKLVSENEKNCFVRIAQDILDGYPANIAIIDEQGSIVMVNAGWRAFASENGSNPDFVSEGSNYFDVCERATGIDAEDIQQTASILRAALKGEPVGFSKVYHCHSPNAMRWFCLRATPVVFNGITKVMVAHENITDFKLVEKSLRENEERMRVVFETTQSAIFQIEPCGTVSLANNRMAQMFGYPPGGILGKHYLELVHPDERARGDHNMSLLMNGELDHVNLERRYIRAGGEDFWGHLSGQRLSSQDGRFLGLVGIIADITERKKMQDLMVQTEKMMSLGGLAAGMAHEINNPLSGILQNAQVILNRLTTDSHANLDAAVKTGCDFSSMHKFLVKRGIVDMLASVRESAIRASRIVTSMLDFARKSDSSKILVDINEILDKAIELSAADYNLNNKYDFRNICITKEYDQRLPSVPCVPSGIQQVFLNLLTNAAQAMVQTRAPTIALRTMQEGDMIRIEMEDNGPGMDEVVRKRIFEPFFSTKPAGSGTGLGLSISFFIITDTHQGSMNVESSFDNGTRFIIRLPLSG